MLRKQDPLFSLSPLHLANLTSISEGPGRARGNVQDTVAQGGGSGDTNNLTFEMTLWGSLGAVCFFCLFVLVLSVKLKRIRRGLYLNERDDRENGFDAAVVASQGTYRYGPFRDRNW